MEKRVTFAQFCGLLRTAAYSSCSTGLTQILLGANVVSDIIFGLCGEVSTSVPETAPLWVAAGNTVLRATLFLTHLHDFYRTLFL